MDYERESAAKRGYDHRWRKARESFLRKHPLCVECSKIGIHTPATVVDHIIPHRGDSKLFWDKTNWQSLCRPHHDRDKQRLEKSGRVIGCDASGMPLDPNHHWVVKTICALFKGVGRVKSLGVFTL